MTPVRHLAEAGFLDAAPTLVHCVNVTDEDIRIIAEHGCTVVTCPRSNSHLRCGVFAWEKFERAGVPIALATDSVASAHDLDLAAEVDAALELHGPELTLGRAVQWLCAGGQRALGRAVPMIGVGTSGHALSLFGTRPEGRESSGGAARLRWLDPS